MEGFDEETLPMMALFGMTYLFSRLYSWPYWYSRSLFLGEDFALHLGDHDLKIVVHGVLLISVTVTLIILRSSTNGN